METTIVILIVGAAVVYCIQSVIKIYKGDKKCACGGNCSLKDTECNMMKDNLKISNMSDNCGQKSLSDHKTINL